MTLIETLSVEIEIKVARLMNGLTNIQICKQQAATGMGVRGNSTYSNL